MQNVPQAINYQTLLRDFNENALTTPISIRFLIISGNVANTPDYVETHFNIQPNSQGIINVKIGEGTPLTGMFNNINWQLPTYYKIEVDLDLSGTFLPMGNIQPFVTVPYAFTSKYAENVINQQSLSLNGDTLVLSGGGSIVLPQSNDTDPTNELIGDFYLLGNILHLEDNGNHYQIDLSSLNSNTVNWNDITGVPADILDGDDVGIPSETDPVYSSSVASSITSTDTANWNNDSDNQNLTGSSLSGTTLTIDIDNGTSTSVNLSDLVDDADADPNNELQAISISNDTIYLSNGGFVKLPTSSSFSGNWNDLTNIPADILDGDDVGITSETDPLFSSSIASSITSTDTANWNNDSDNQNLTGSSLSGTTLTIDIENGTSTTVNLSGLVDDADADPNNELQAISISNDTIYLSNGGFVKLPVSTSFSGNWNDLTNVPADLLDGDDVGITSETDPIYTASPASGISNTDITNWNTDLVDDADADITNELQNLSLLNDTLYISDGNFVSLSNLGDNTDEQDLTLVNDSLLISNGTGVDLSSFKGDSSYWTLNTDSSLNYAGPVIVGDNSADTSAIFQLNSTTQGFLPPRMTMADRDAIAAPATGLMVYNTDQNCPNYYNGLQWMSLCSSFSNACPCIDTTNGAPGSTAPTAYAIDTAWSFGDIGNDDEKIYDVATDSYGNVYAIGTFYGINQIDGINIASVGNEDIFVAKFDNNGNGLWVSTFGSLGTDYGYKVDVDDLGNAYIAGSFGGTFTIAKYNSSGTQQWIKSATSASVAQGISVGSDGSIYASGNFSGTLNFEGVTLSSAYSYDGIIFKWNSAGVLQWYKQMEGNTGSEFAYAIDVDAFGNVYTTGIFHSSILQVGTDSLTNYASSSYDVFISKHDASGNLVWLKQAGGSNHDYGRDIFVNDNGSFYLAGDFTSTVASFGSFSRVNAGGQDAFIAMYDSSGTPLWVNVGGASGNETGRSVCADSLGNVYSCGLSSSSLAIFNGSTVERYGYTVKYDASGNFVWVKRSGGTSGSTFGASGCAADQGGNVWVGGGYVGNGYAGSTTLPNPSSTSNNIFLWKYHE